MTPLNERIARLLEQEPSIDECEENRHSDCFGWIGTRHDGWVPATFKESIDASMAAIERRWPNAVVELTRGSAWLNTQPALRTTIYTHKMNAASRAEALALALCAALEAEVTP